jgi:KDO2-lipid IV(A) lauroyltransferase
MRTFFSRLLVAFLWLLHWLPLPILRALGYGLGRLLFALGKERREVALTNLRLCFPEKTEGERLHLARQHFIAFSRGVLDRTLGWWASPARLKRLVRVQGLENLQPADGRPVIVLAPHFVGLDAAATRLTMDARMCGMFSNQKNPVFNAVIYRGRIRFNNPLLLSRQDGIRRILQALKAGYIFYYMPDLDYGPKESIFVPFFGVSAATITGVSRLARATGAHIVPCITRQVADGYETRIMPALENFPGDSVEADTALINRFIESQVLHMPEQYFWLHKRFKTRPVGEQRYYK